MKKKKVKDTQENWSHKNDYSLEEVWNTENTLAQLIVPRLQAFKALDKHGAPSDFKDMREWNNAIQKMINAFELMKSTDALHLVFICTKSTLSGKESTFSGKCQQPQ